MALPPDSFVALGLASCFVREGNELIPIQVVEPIPSAALLALLKGSPTSYSLLVPSSLAILTENDNTVALPQEFPQEAKLAHEFNERLLAAARTFVANPKAIEALKDKVLLDNPSPQQRILNQAHQVNDADNVKQHAHTHKTL